MEKAIIEEKKSLILENFNSTHENVLATVENYIMHGYIQTIANLLVYIGENRAQNVLKKLPEPVQKVVGKRYENLPSDYREKPCVFSDVKYVLKICDVNEKSLCEAVTQGLDSNSLHLLSLETEELAKTDPIIAKSIEKYLFKFEDFMNLDGRSIQKVLRETDQNTIALALKNAETILQGRIFRNMSKRACKMLKDDMESMGAVRLSDIETARLEMVQTVRRLEANGEIIVFKEDETKG
jgi:flagellar motor switch protein FliG